MSVSIRTRLLMGTTFAAAATLVVAGVSLYGLVRTSLVAQVDASLEEKARLIASTIEQDEGELEFEFDAQEFEHGDRGGYLQLWTADGETVFHSASLGSAALERPSGTLDRPRRQWVELPGGIRGRAIGFTFEARVEESHERPMAFSLGPVSGVGGDVRVDDDRGSDSDSDRGSDSEDDSEDDEDEVRDGGPGLGAISGTPGEAVFPAEPSPPLTLNLALARDTRQVDQALMTLRGMLALVGLATLFITGGVLWLTIRHSLRPLGVASGELATIGEADLSRRVTTQHAPAELLPVVERVNGLLGRLESAFARERAFSNEVAHELRTPLAGLRTTLEVAQGRSRSPEEYSEIVQDSLTIALQMQGMIERLLQMARLEAGGLRPAMEPVLVSEAVTGAWGSLSEVASSRRLEVEWDLDTSLEVETDKHLLRLVLRNLLENAVAYVDHGGTVRIKARVASDARWEVEVTNSGSVLTQSQAEQATQRLWRGQAARTDAGLHCGLGLSLVDKAIAVLHGGLRLHSAQGGEFRAVASLPLRRPRRGARVPAEILGV